MLINVVTFFLGLTTGFAIIGVIALRDWHAKLEPKKKNETEEEEELLTRT